MSDALSFESTYLIIGSSHAALEAVSAIRMQDTQGSITLVTRDPHLPYSPTILPYIVSGQAIPEKVRLRDERYFDQHNVTLIRGDALVRLEAERNSARFASGSSIGYEKLLLATGATPIIPPIPGLDRVPFHVIRTLDDALGLRDAMQHARRAVVLGAGFVGTHAAENLAHAGAEVTLVEMHDQVLPGYFDAAAARMISATYAQHGIAVRNGERVVQVEATEDGARIHLQSGQRLEADLLVVSTGVRPVIDYLEGSGIDSAQGSLVDEKMQTNLPTVWAAGDVAEATGFLPGGTGLNGILPDAVEQGRIAGMAMCEDPATKTYPGGVPMNTFSFFGHQAISVGRSLPLDGEPETEIVMEEDSERLRFLKVLLQDNRLVGISSINRPLDAGVMWQLILRRTDLSTVRDAFLKRPLETGRQLMSSLWR